MEQVVEQRVNSGARRAARIGALGVGPQRTKVEDGKRSQEKNLARPAPNHGRSSQTAGLATGALNRHDAPPNIDAPFRNASDPISSPER